MSQYKDFNDAERSGFEPMPSGTLAKVRMTIKPGHYDNEEQGWDGEWATLSDKTGAVYLSCEFVVLEGPFTKRKAWSNIGLFSSKGPDYANMGRAMLRGILESARNVKPSDMSAEAKQRRCIRGLGDLDGIEFIARFDLEKDQNGNDRNVVKTAVTPDHSKYAELMFGAGAASAAPRAAPSAQAALPGTKTPSAGARAAAGTKAASVPDWAK